MIAFARIIKENTAIAPPPLVPEIRLHLADDAIGLWQKIETETGKNDTPPPFWAFAWAGGQAVARYVLDHPGTVAGKTVLDFGAGSGLIGIAAAKAGAASVTAADISPLAAEAIALNAAENGAALQIVSGDVIGRTGWDVVLVGDMCYERPLAERLTAWLNKERALGTVILIGDPGRNYFPQEKPKRLAKYDVPTPRTLEDRDMRQTGVFRW